MTVFDTCTVCPRLCRHACPVATVWEPGTPTHLASVLRDHAAGRVDDELALAAATACTDCGACRAACALDRPLPEALRAVRARLRPPEALAPCPTPPDGAELALTRDDRPWPHALGRRLGRPITAMAVPDLGRVDPASLHAALTGRTVIVADGASAAALTAVGLPFTWLHVALGWDGVGSCVSGGHRPLACCGGAGPLAQHHPGPADALARLAASRADGPWVDTRCAARLRAAGLRPDDIVDRLLRTS